MNKFTLWLRASVVIVLLLLAAFLLWQSIVRQDSALMLDSLFAVLFSLVWVELNFFRRRAPP